MDNNLADIRNSIDKIDQELVGLLSRRAQFGIEAGKAKKTRLKFSPSREAQVIANVKAANTGPLQDQTLEAIMREIISGCLNLEQSLRVSYLGPEGTYSEDAARSRFGAMAEYVPMDNIDKVLHCAEQNHADLAVLPIENSIEGSVGQTLDLLLNTNLKICDEIIIPIHHQLLSLSQDLKDVKEVIAHPQALAQCREWLTYNLPGVELLTASSNAQAARIAATKPGCAAIASARAAKLCGLRILASNIEDSVRNTTRFIVLGPESAKPSTQDKTSVVCATANKPGALLEILKQLASRKINMVKLESRPSKAANWEYVFYIDIEGHADDEQIRQALHELKQHTNFIKLLGSYPSSRMETL